MAGAHIHVVMDPESASLLLAWCKSKAFSIAVPPSVPFLAWQQRYSTPIAIPLELRSTVYAAGLLQALVASQFAATHAQ